MASGKALVRRVDHFYVPLDDADKAFAFLVDDLKLPIAWPFTNYGIFASGGVHLGNANLEIIRSNDAFHHGKAMSPARVRGIAFEPLLEITHEFGAELDRCAIPHSPPMPLRVPGRDDPLWTNVGFGDWFSISGTFACKYHFIDVDDSRASLRRQLDAIHGGTLGLEEVAEIVFGAPDMAAATALWQNVLDPVEPSEPGLWRIGDGPAVRIAEADDDGVQRLVVRVRDVGEAMNVLGADGATVSVAPLGGLVLQFVQ